MLSVKVMDKNRHNFAGDLKDPLDLMLQVVLVFIHKFYKQHALHSSIYMYTCREREMGLKL